MTRDYEPDYEAIIEAREQERDEAWVARMDAKLGRTDEWVWDERLGDVVRKGRAS